jgi:tetratricopeptide (TPR) repeat protein
MKIRPLMLVFWLSIMLLPAAALVTASRAQPKPGWSWPEKPKNLKVLPADIGKDRLRSTMIGFTRALGNRCSDCHVGQEDQPLETYDFASDENPKKNVARGMLRMVDSINVQLGRIRPTRSEGVQLSCVTCHRGVAIPRTLVQELTVVYDKSGADSAAATYAALRSAHEDAGAYDFREGGLITLAYRALARKDVAGAVTLFELNLERFPTSGTAHHVLADGYLAAADTARAVANYRRALELNPRDENAAKQLEALKR